jgi:predicted O-methyltransferase YrrM
MQDLNIDYLIKEALVGNGDSSKHKITLFAIAVSIGAKKILELGVRDGQTTAPLLWAAGVNGGDLTSVDILENPSVRQQFESSNWDYKILNAITFIEQIPNGLIYDLIFIDDWHDADHLLKEIQLLEKHINSSTLILLHDTMCYNTQPHYHFYKDKDGEFANGGPFGALLRLDEGWEYATIPVNNGLTILRKKTKNVEF